MAKELILFGGGGHCRSCIDVLESEGIYHIAGIIDHKERVGQFVSGYPIIGSEEDLLRFSREYRYFLLTFGFIKEVEPRIEKFDLLKRSGSILPVVVSSLGHVSRLAAVEEGTIVMHRAVVNSHARVGKNCIINTGAIIEHDVSIGDFCHVSTHAVVNGTAKIGARCFIGSNSVVANNTVICDDVILGAGSVVVKPIEIPGIYVGNPARRIQ